MTQPASNPVVHSKFSILTCVANRNDHWQVLAQVCLQERLRPWQWEGFVAGSKRRLQHRCEKAQQEQICIRCSQSIALLDVHMHKQRQYKQRFIKHPYQPNNENSNCGVFVCKLMSLLLQDEQIHSESNGPLNISTFRETVLNSLAWALILTCLFGSLVLHVRFIH